MMGFCQILWQRKLRATFIKIKCKLPFVLCSQERVEPFRGHNCSIHDGIVQNFDIMAIPVVCKINLNQMWSLSCSQEIDYGQTTDEE